MGIILDYVRTTPWERLPSFLPPFWDPLSYCGPKAKKRKEESDRVKVGIPEKEDLPKTLIEVRNNGREFYISSK